MSRYLALDAEQGKLYLASANVKGSAVKLEKAIVLADVGTLTPANAAEVGNRLKEAMREAGIAPGPALLAVGRERVVLKEIRYPASVTAAEEPNVIRFQVSKELSESPDSVVIDYFAHPLPEPDGQRRALAFAVRKEILNAVRLACSAAGLKMAGVTPRPFGVAASLMRAIKDGAVTPPESPNAPLAVLVRGDKWGELVILRGGQVSFSRSLTAMAINSETAMLGEIRRNLAVFAGQSAQLAVQALYVAEGEMPGGWSGRLAASLNIPVQSFDPIADADTEIEPEHRGSFAGLVGLVALRARSAELPVNFLEPREPKRSRDPNKRLLVLVGACAALIFLAVMAVGLWQANEKSKATLALQNQKQELESDIAALGDTKKRIEIVADWQRKSVCWLDEIYDLTAVFPDPRGTEAVKLTYSINENQAKGTIKSQVGAMMLEVNTESGRAIEILNSDIHDGFRKTDATSQKPSIRRAQKSLQFDLRASIEHRDPDKYKAQLNAAAPPAKRERFRDDANSAEDEQKGPASPMGGGQ